MMAACAGAATLLSIRKVHAWHLSTFADGTLVGLVAWPLSVFLTAAFLWRNVGFGWHALLYGFIGLLITVPCGWLAGFAYHLSLTAAERARSGNDEDMVS